MPVHDFAGWLYLKVFSALYTISILTDICRCLAGWQLDRYRSIFRSVATFAAQIQPRFSQIWESYGDLSPVRRFYYENFSFCYEIKKLPQSTCNFTVRIRAIFSIFQFLLWNITRNWRYMRFSANICQYSASGQPPILDRYLALWLPISDIDRRSHLSLTTRALFNTSST